MKNDEEHALRFLSFYRVTCACSWHFENNKLKDKTQSDLLIENGLEFKKHALVFAKKKRGSADKGVSHEFPDVCGDASE